MSREEIIVLYESVEANLEKEFFCASFSSAGSPVLFVKKPHKSLCRFVNYRGLNVMTIKNRYPLRLIRETLDRLSKAQWYTKLNLRQGSHLIRMALK